ncbi:MAG: type I 3-dehydroquinate dehydratase [Verrucomicrobiaceae bacterium]|nr:type I 3-dehydroquinate dehydratase [Verrucomicrobiaceae bacterium]
MPQTISSKNLLLSTSPLTVGVVSDAAVLERFCNEPPNVKEAACDLVELRLDLLEMPIKAILDACDHLARPILFTARHPAEGGKGPESDAERAAMLEPFLDKAALIDLELRSVPGMAGLISKARSRGVGVVGSFHDFQATPADDVLAGAREFAETAGIDAVKLAVFLNSAGDLIRLMNQTIYKRRLPIATMGMGPLGRMSRVALAKIGSLLNYGFLGNSNAPGQWPAPRLKEILSQL